MNGGFMLTLDKIYDARRAIGAIVRRTDLIKTPLLANGCELYLKPENLQFTGSFKLRGAAYKIARLTEEEKSHGVIACSAGNHAQGVALSATKSGIKSIVCMPENAPIMKVEATRSYGAEVVLVPGVYDDAYSKAVELKNNFGYTFVHPFDDENVIAGQGTIALEILDDLPDSEVIVVPVGGGGLISGVAFAAKSINPNVKVYGVQAEGAPSMSEAIKAGKPIKLGGVSTFADGIAVKEVGKLTYDVVSKYVDGIVTVSEDEIASAILAMLEKQKIISEGAGAVAFAAVKAGKIPCQNKKTVCVVSGGNIDVNILSNVIERGLIASGRIHNLKIALPDRPGQLNAVTAAIAENGGNVVTVHHERGKDAFNLNGCNLDITIETRDAAQIEKIDSALRRRGYNIIKTEY